MSKQEKGTYFDSRPPSSCLKVTGVGVRNQNVIFFSFLRGGGGRGLGSKFYFFLFHTMLSPFQYGLICQLATVPEI